MGKCVKCISLCRFYCLVAPFFPCTHHPTIRQENNNFIAMVIMDFLLVSLLHYRSLLHPQHVPRTQLHLRRSQGHLHVLHLFHRSRSDCRILRVLSFPSDCNHSIIPHYRRSLHPSLPLSSSITIQIKIIIQTVRSTRILPSPLLC
jgi:hypothetical protein